MQRKRTRITTKYEKVERGSARPERRTMPTYDVPEETGPVRLNKYIANAGLCSRRDADKYIAAGLITVNGKVVTELGTKVNIGDDVRYNGQRMSQEKKVYILLNKPKDYVTTVEDPNAKKTVMDLIKNACRERVYPVGRLDRNTTGVLLLTNDGDLAKKLTHPMHKQRKIYLVTLNKSLRKEDVCRLIDGVVIDEEGNGKVKADAVEFPDPDDKKQVGIELHSGENRVVRRMFEKLGYKVTKLDRVYFAGLTKRNLPRGKWRYLEPQEVNMLKRFSK